MDTYIVKGKRTKILTLDEAVRILNKHDELFPTVDYDDACEVISAMFCISVADLKGICERK